MVGLLGFMVFNATFNNSSIISLGSVLSVEETGDPRENQVHHLIEYGFLEVCKTIEIIIRT
jgi:hypothetical protein